MQERPNYSLRNSKKEDKEDSFVAAVEVRTGKKLKGYKELLRNFNPTPNWEDQLDKVTALETTITTIMSYSLSCIKRRLELVLYNKNFNKNHAHMPVS